MSVIKEKIYYSFTANSEGKKPITNETFIDKTKFDWHAHIENNYQTILEEVLFHYKSHEAEFNPYFADELMNAPGKWRSFGFYFWGVRAQSNICKHFTKTIALLKNVPGIVSASVSVMEPNSEIKPHFGDTNAIHRCHLGLIIPASIPEVGLQVAYEKRSWEEGKLLIFNDGAYHKAWNNSSKKRIVLIFDVIRPEYTNQKSWICARINSIMLSQNAIKQNPWMNSFFKLKTTQILFSLFTWCYLHTLKRKYLWL